MDKTQDPNKLFRVRLGQGESRLRILLSQRKGVQVPQEDDEGSAKRYGVGKRHHRPDELIPRQARNFINFWDLGQVFVTDHYEDLAYSADLVQSDPDPFNGFDPLATADWNALRDLILSIDPVNWETYYKQLSYTEAERYSLDVVAAETYPVARNGSRFVNATDTVVAGTKWTPNGLQVPGPLTSFTLDSWGAFFYWGTGSGFTKWTLTPDYSDPDEGEQPLQPNAKVFMMPRIIINGSYANDGVNSDVMLTRYKALQRSFWLNRNYDVTPYPLYSYPGFASPLDLSDTDKLALIEELRVGAIEFDNLGGLHGDPSAWPMYNTYAASVIGGVDNHAITVFDPMNNYINGALLGMIKQSNKIYYIWWDNGSGGYRQDRPVVDYVGLV